MFGKGQRGTVGIPSNDPGEDCVEEAYIELRPELRVCECALLTWTTREPGHGHSYKLQSMHTIGHGVEGLHGFKFEARLLSQQLPHVCGRLPVTASRCLTAFRAFNSASNIGCSSNP